MTDSLSPKTISIVTATIPALEAHGLDIVNEMYARMFETPEIRDMFDQSHQGSGGSQPRALTSAILAYAKNIETLAALGPAVERIAQKHVGLQILPEHYPFVGQSLLGAIKAVLGDAATDEVLDAWGEAYGFLANVLIAREAELYDALKTTEGGWAGFREFVVDSVKSESLHIKSFGLRSRDSEPVLRQRPGQYLTLELDIPGHGTLRRNYSLSGLSDANSYRISIKREELGIASGWMHDNALVGTVLKVAAPAGDFYLDTAPQRPVVLLSGGVGLTPMIAMLESLQQEDTAREIHYVHATQNGATHAMKQHVDDLSKGRRHMRIATFYEAPMAEDIGGRDYHHEGRVSREWLSANTPTGTADYYLCGPKPFLRAIVNALVDLGVTSDRIHYEFFGPADEILAA